MLSQRHLRQQGLLPSGASGASWEYYSSLVCRSQVLGLVTGRLRGNGLRSLNLNLRRPISCLHRLHFDVILGSSYCVRYYWKTNLIEEKKKNLLVAPHRLPEGLTQSDFAEAVAKAHGERVLVIGEWEHDKGESQ